MALTGTLSDFGIAEILQLIGQQAKSGVLHLAGGGEEIHVLMTDGSVVSAECGGRARKDRLGGMLLRAEVITREDLERALAAQGRTLRRLGDILVEMQLVSKDVLKEFMALQTTETVYRLFSWKSGTYEFEPGAVEWDASTMTPLRAESVLMEGFRRVDEWPAVRRRISSPAMTFVPLGEMPDPASADPSLGPNERRVFTLARPGVTVERIVDLSRLGEFETCRSLLTLVNLELLKPIAPARRSATAGVGEYARSWRERIQRGAAGLAATVALAGALAGAAWAASERDLAVRRDGALRDQATQRFLARYEISRLRGALEVWRLENGTYPDGLEALVESGLCERAEVRYPFDETYVYRRTAGGDYVLLPPLP
jgi:Domain of unknown function (DUF4388)